MTQDVRSPIDLRQTPDALAWEQTSLPDSQLRSSRFYEPGDHVPCPRRDAFAEGLLEDLHEHRAFGAPDVSAVGHTVLDMQDACAVLMVGEFQGRFRRRLEEGDDAFGIL